MELRQLGKSDVRVTPIIFGAWAIGGWMWGGNEEQESIDALTASIDNGVTTIDTAAIYGMGYSEELVGKAIAGRRNKVVIATKCGMRWDTEEGSEPWPQKNREGKDIVIRKNANPKSIALECERSLRRLGIDEIDLYQIHWPDTSTKVEDSMAAMVKLKNQGKIRAIGASNYDVKWLAAASKVAPVASDQPPYSLIQRKIEADVLPFCRENNIGVIVYSPLERGLLTGKVEPERRFPPGDHRAQHKYFTVENRERVLEALRKIRPIAEKHKASLTQVVINWTAHQPGITAALVGARNAEQAKHNARSLDFTLTGDELGQIRAAFDEPAKVMNA
ncbi:MAG TPA: aldo/keto reductase [Tepidisphaeraceae bacterium]|jgi:aryl-alcohol dehydrogenase-like predicted oxidoreductase|nr:aldo/keto reductase [Tepidisphaeraceae bacterium]